VKRATRRPHQSAAATCATAVTRLSRALTLAPLAIYRAVLSPFLLALLGPACRFEPSCSEYAIAAISRHGVARGLWMAFTRLIRCRPGGRWGYDPVAPLAPVRRPGPRFNEREVIGQ
jgi:putative membrane protein insertion efficiency factor